MHFMFKYLMHKHIIYRMHLIYIYIYIYTIFTFTFMHLADAFIQSDLQCIQAIHLYCQYVCIYIYIYISTAALNCIFLHKKFFSTLSYGP